MNYLFRYIIFCILISSVSHIHAQVFKTEFEYMNKESNGLAHNHVFSVSQDSDGFIWLCTMGGLSKYDGANFTNFRHNSEDSTSISSSYAKKFFHDSKGRYWVTTNNGFNKFDRRRGTFKRYHHDKENENSLGHNNLHGIAEDSEGNIWIANSKGLDKFNPETEEFTHYFHPSYSVARYSGNVIVDEKDEVWAIGERGLFKVDKVNYTLIYYGQPDIISDIILEGREVYLDCYSNLWMGTNRGLAKFDRETEKFEVLPHSVFKKGIHQMTEYPKGILAVGTSGNGLVLFDAEKEEVVNNYQYRSDNPDGIAGNWVYSVFMDKDENLWAGLFYGLNRLNLFNRRFGLLQNAPGINNLANFTLLIHQDQKGGYWINTMEGLVFRKKLEDEPRQMLYPPLFSEGFNDVKSIHGDKEGGVYFFIPLSGLFKYDYATDRIENFVGLDVLRRGAAWVIKTDVLDQDKLLVGRGVGLCKLSKSTKDTIWYYPKEINSELTSNELNRFTQTEDGLIYFLNSGKLCRFDYNKCEIEILSKEGENIGRAFAINYVDEWLWIGSTKGVYKYNILTKEWTVYKDNGKDIYVAGLQVDDFGDGWGVQETSTVHFRKDGQVDSYRIPSGTTSGIGAKGIDGHLLFGGYNGALFVDPVQAVKRGAPPKLILTGVEIANDTIGFEVQPEYIEVVLTDYDSKVITFNFTTLHFNKRESNRYYYYLEGFEENWIVAGANKQVTYTNLKPGRYTFRAKAISEDGYESIQALAIPVHIRAPYYMTKAFLVFLVALGLLLIYIYYAVNRRAILLSREKKLAEQNAAYKSMFLANMSHEIRTPMNAIIGLNRLLLDTPLNSKQKEFVEAIQTSGENLLWIVNDILDQAKIESGKYTLITKPFNLQVVLNQIRTLFSYKAKEKGLEFNISSSDEIPEILIGDQVRLFQILTNLLGNALKFTEAGSISLQVDHKITENNGVQMIFSVIDTGRGIAKEDQEQIFESFHQLEDEISTGNQGTGLGLSIVQHLVVQLGGEISLESEPGRGSHFMVSIPYTFSVDKIAVGEIEENISLPENLRVLLVEDTFFNQLLAQELLEKYFENIHVQIAENGLIALEKIQGSEKFDLVLMDVKMPVMDGIEATKRIRQLQPEYFKMIPILGLTANAIASQIELCIASGMNDCITKPIDPEELVSKISKVVRND